MTKKFTCPVGVMGMTDRLKATELIEFVQFLEKLNYESFWIPELFGREIMANTAYCIAHTEEIKIAPGITQMERRLEAPLQALMNAYSAAFPAMRGSSMRPFWRTLTATDAEGAWIGRVKFGRFQDSAASHTASPAEWRCTVQIPAEHYGKLIRTLLSGAKGDIKALNPLLFASLYAENRADTAPLLNAWLRRGDNVVLDRYVEANFGHQASKLPPDERPALINQLAEFEHGANIVGI